VVWGTQVPQRGPEAEPGGGLGEKPEPNANFQLRRGTTCTHVPLGYATVHLCMHPWKVFAAPARRRSPSRPLPPTSLCACRVFLLSIPTFAESDSDSVPLLIVAKTAYQLKSTDFTVMSVNLADELGNKQLFILLICLVNKQLVVLLIFVNNEHFVNTVTMGKVSHVDKM